MKRILLLAFSYGLVISGYAQSALSKVPAGASLVTRYSGKNFTMAVPIDKLESYGFIRNDIFKSLHIDSLSSLSKSGVDLQKDILQYLEYADSANSFVTLLPLKDKAAFLKVLRPDTGTNMKVLSKNGYDFLNISKSSFVALSNDLALLINTVYKSDENYYSSAYYDHSDSTAVVAQDPVTIITNDIPPPPAPTVKNKKPAKPKPTVKPKQTLPKKPLPKKSAKAKEMLDADEDEAYVKAPYSIEADSIETMKRDLWYQKQEMKAVRKQQEAAEQVAIRTFTGNFSPMMKQADYEKIIDPEASVSVWMNTNTLFSQYSRTFMGAYSMFYRSGFTNDSSGGFKSAANVYFDKDKMRIEQKSYSPDPVMTNLVKDVMNSKQSNSLVSFVNPGNIGYFSISVNTEATASYYYNLLRNYMSADKYMHDYASVIDLYIDFLEIAVDEKALGDLMPGNFMFVMHDLKPRTVSYTTYTFDNEYNQSEVKKTKTEMSPDFSFIIETRKQGFMEKLAKLPLKYAEKENYKYFDRGGYYELVLDSSNAVGNVFFVVKDGKGIVTTSKEVVDMALSGKTYDTDAAVKKSIMSNNYSLKLNAEKLIDKLSSNFSTKVSKKISAYLLENVGDVKMESNFRDGMAQSTTIMNIRGTHKNSLEFFFNMIDSLNNIIEQDKFEQSQKLD